MLSRLNIAQRVALGFAILNLLMLAVGAAGMQGLQRQYREVNELLAKDLNQLQTVQSAQLRMSKMRRDEKDIFLSLGSQNDIDEYHKKWTESVNRVGESLQKLGEKAGEEEQAQIEKATIAMASYSEGMTKAMSGMSVGFFMSSLMLNDSFEPAKQDAQVANGALNEISKAANNRIQQIDDRLADIRREVVTTGAVLVALAVLLGIVSGWLIIRSVRAPLAELQRQIGHIARSGELSRRMPEKSTDEIGQTSRAINQLLSGMGDVIGVASRDAKALLTAADSLYQTAEHVTQASGQQASSAHATADAVEELSTSIAQVAERATSVEEVAESTANTASSSVGMARTTADHIRTVAQTTQHSAELIDSLNQRSDEIGNIVQVIKEIADQTSLLALNAAIEAARAGEQGRGFAVVADEVRKLAERTTAATVDIQARIEGVQRDTGVAAEDMHQASDQIAQGVGSTEQVAEHLREIERLSRESAQHTADIAMAIREQSSASESISSHIEEIAAASTSNNEAASESHRLSRQLGEIATQINTAIQRFSV
ncbi:MAG: hypothetical protein CGU28_02990 [Candidatus Dactylopiibacterium carminicum]|nr:MAG: hypothetical protein CGU28_02990 [Candidatus Dactylopiibacterium carminicum]